MSGVHDLALFVLSGWLLNVTPGPDTLYIVGRSMTQGWRAGATAALGIGAGLCLHTLDAAAGVSALLMASATAFTIVKLLGAAYLVYIGLQLTLLRSGTGPLVPAGDQRPVPLRRVFMQGLLTNAVNPKVALFFLAFLPQFVDAEAPNHFAALVFLGVVFNVNGTLWNFFTAWVASRAAGALERRRRLLDWVNRVTGGLIMAVGVRLAFMTRD